MPEGDTIHAAARRVGAALVGKDIVSIETPHQRHAMDGWPDRLAGRPVRSVDAHGKHLFRRRWSRSPHRAWLVIRTPEHSIDPWRKLAETTDDEVLQLVRAIRGRMQESVSRGGHIRGLRIHDRAGQPCPRCSNRIRSRGQGDDNRTTYWCPACQR